MPFREIYMTAFKNDIEYSQLILQTAAILQSNKFMQVTAALMESSFFLGCMMETSGLTALCVWWVWCGFSVFLSSLSWPEKMSWTNCEKRSRSSGRESKRKWWVDSPGGCTFKRTTHKCTLNQKLHWPGVSAQQCSWSDSARYTNPDK